MLVSVCISQLLLVSLSFFNCLQSKFLPTAKINLISISIKPVFCNDARGNNGTCMFKLACIQAKGTPIGICKDNTSIYTGSCCHFPNQQSDTSFQSNSITSSTSNNNSTFTISPPSIKIPTSTHSSASTSLASTTSLTSQITLSHPFTTQSNLPLALSTQSTQLNSTYSSKSSLPFEINNIVIIDNHAQNHVSSRPSILTTPYSTTFMTPISIATKTSSLTEAASLLNVTETSESTSSPSSSTHGFNQTFNTTDFKTNEIISSSSVTLPTFSSSSSTTIASSSIITSSSSTPASLANNSSLTSLSTVSTLPSSSPLTTNTVPSTTSTKYTQSSLDRPSTVSNKTPTQSSIQSICGRKMSQIRGRIVGGTRSYFSEWPWMVSLRQWKKNAFLHKCGAALLNEYWAITAAHCIENVASTDLLLRLGEYDVSNEHEPYSHIDRRVQIIAPHPKFDPRTFEFDLALLRFFDPIPLRKNVLPVCLPDHNKSYVGEWATVTGWGRLYEDGPLPNTLQHVEVPVITNKECETMYKRAGYIEEIPNIFICAGISRGGKDSCEGDSGGPLVIEEKGKWNLIGIISWGIGCALPNQPGVYTRITEFSKWINQIIAY